MVEPADPARNRFLLLSLTRIGGALLILVGLLAANRRFESLSPVIGIVLVLVGAFGFAIAPRILARRWRNPN